MFVHYVDGVLEVDERLLEALQELLLLLQKLQEFLLLL